MIRYADATPADGEALNAMALACFVETFGAEYRAADLDEYCARAYAPGGLRADLADPAIRFRVARSDDAITGYAKLSALTLPVAAPEPGAMELRQLYVFARWHGAGIARTLMDWAIDRARSDGAPALYLAVFEYNHRARAFYARHGFADIVGTFAFRMGERVDQDRIMRLAL